MRAVRYRVRGARRCARRRRCGVRHGLIEEALQRLPDQQRLPLVLYHFEELSYEEIAQQLGVSLAKVKTDIFRARAALAKVLAERGVTAATSLGAP